MKNYDVFVYGTLRKGGTNHYYLEDSCCIREKVWLSGYCLYDFQHLYPFMLEASPKDQVRGEVYRVDTQTLEQLNVLEDVDHQLYRLVYQDQYGFFTYLKYSHNVEGLSRISGGDWLKYIGMSGL